NNIKNINIDDDILNSNIDMNIHVLTSGTWPSYDLSTITLPNIIQKYQDSYKKFYTSIQNGRKLNYSISLSHCIIKGNLPKGEKRFVLSAYQGTVLLL